MTELLTSETRHFIDAVFFVKKAGSAHVGARQLVKGILEDGATAKGYTLKEANVKDTSQADLGFYLED